MNLAVSMEGTSVATSKYSKYVHDAFRRPLLGRTIVKVFEFNHEEYKNMDWYPGSHPAIVIQLDDGTVVVPAQDPELNDSGYLYIINENDSEGDEE